MCCESRPFQRCGTLAANAMAAAFASFRRLATAQIVLSSVRLKSSKIPNKCSSAGCYRSVVFLKAFFRACKGYSDGVDVAL